MAESTVPFTISYRKPELRVPVFVAGSFTEPAWQLQEMQRDEDGTGNPAFVARVQVVPGREYQYKFKIRDRNGDWWALDEQSPIVTDAAGNRNNLLNVPLPSASEAGPGGKIQKTDPASTSDTLLAPSLVAALGVPGIRTDTATPIEQVAKTAAEVADTAQMLDRNARTPSPDVVINDENDPPGAVQDFKSPLFSHESLGGYEFVDDGLHHDSTVATGKSQGLKLGRGYAFHDIDLNDPTIEKFPSDKSSVLDALRKLQSGIGEDLVRPEDFLPTRYGESSGGSMDSGDEGFISPGSLSPTSTRRRDSRHSQSSFGRIQSAASLGSIAEEDHKDVADRIASGLPSIRLSSDKGELPSQDPAIVGATEDEALAMRLTGKGSELLGSSLNQVKGLNINLPGQILSQSTSQGHPDTKAASPAPRSSNWSHLMDGRRATLLAVGIVFLGLGIAWMRSSDRNST